MDARETCVPLAYDIRLVDTEVQIPQDRFGERESVNTSRQLISLLYLTPDAQTTLVLETRRVFEPATRTSAKVQRRGRFHIC